MSDKEKLTGLTIFTFTLWAVWAYNLVVDHAELRDYKSRITALEQSQCAVKQESLHNQVKFDLCMDKQKR